MSGLLGSLRPQRAGLGELLARARLLGPSLTNSILRSRVGQRTKVLLVFDSPSCFCLGLLLSLQLLDFSVLFGQSLLPKQPVMDTLSLHDLSLVAHVGQYLGNLTNFWFVSHVGAKLCLELLSLQLRSRRVVRGPRIQWVRPKGELPRVRKLLLNYGLVARIPLVLQPPLLIEVFVVHGVLLFL